MTRPAGIGHNNGPSLPGGKAWQTYCWTKARADLLPTLPIEVVRLRVKCAREIGLQYSPYARIRATSSRDVIALLFSSEALGLYNPDPEIPIDRLAKLRAVKGCDRLLLARAPLDPATLARQIKARHGLAFSGAAAPRDGAGWRAQRTAIRAALDPRKMHGDAVLLVSDGRDGRAWCDAGQLAGFLGSAQFFQGQAAG